MGVRDNVSCRSAFMIAFLQRVILYNCNIMKMFFKQTMTIAHVVTCLQFFLYLSLLYSHPITITIMYSHLLFQQ